MKYRKKPVVIDAFQWTADENQLEDPSWFTKAIENDIVWFENGGTENVTIVIKTLEGNHIGKRNDYIIRRVKGELYPCKPDIFEMTYEKVSENE